MGKTSRTIIGVIVAVHLFGAPFFIPTPCLAAFYKYVDENGVTRYTDDLSIIPPDQRPGADSYTTQDDHLTLEQKHEKEAWRKQQELQWEEQNRYKPERNDQEAKKAPAAESERQKAYAREKERLNEKGRAIKQKREELKRETDQLAERRKKLNRASARGVQRKYVHDVDVLKAKWDEWEKEAKAHAAEVQALENKWLGGD